MARGVARAFPPGRSAAAPVIALVMSVAACGSPNYTYVKNSSAQTYFKVPVEWNKIEQKALDAAISSDDPDSAAARLRPKVSWSVAYDAHRSPDPNHLFGLGTDQPFVYAIVRPLTRDERGSISLDRLRDAFLPVTEQSRRTVAEQGSPLTGFELLRDEELKPKGGIRGVRTAYNYRLPPMPFLQTFDVTSYVSDEGRLYVMVVRCSARCFLDRADELDAVARSFTVRT
ncbi:hypothetical protein ACGFNU_12280 [Spirillospora sp. NPDC048911]|uniref:hypothetical protein n=1 Tax=Spirillospora sp. NPDC048911 TaxID=3364527 RepID=UPI0037202ACD